MKHFLLASFVFCSFCLSAQPPIDLNSLTLGIVDDYLGRTIVKTGKLESTKIDRFHQSQAWIMDLLDSLIKLENIKLGKGDRINSQRRRVLDPNCSDCKEYFDYYSRELSKELNSKYRFRFSHSWDMHERKLYRGSIRKSVLTTEAQKLSFLVGAYLTSGIREDSVWGYHYANSVSKFDLVVKCLKELECEIKDIEIANGTPLRQRVYFVPSAKLQAMIEEIVRR